MGFNKKKKGERSYYNLYCTIAQTGQVFDVLYRSGNVHDSNGAQDFVKGCLKRLKQELGKVVLEVRLDSAFFSDEMVRLLEKLGVEFTISVPFERFVELKGLVNDRRVWWWYQQGLSYFEKRWKPKSWKKRCRFLFIRKVVMVQNKAPIQLDLFEPMNQGEDYKVIITNKKNSARKVVRYHEGRGYQEHIFGELKTQGALAYIPVRTWTGNKIYLLSNLLAHNLIRELQMQADAPVRGTCEKRSPLWNFAGLEVVRRTFIQRAGRLSEPQGARTLTMSGNEKVQQTLLHYLDAA